MAVIRNGYLWACQHVGLNSANGNYDGDESGSSVDRSGVQWWKLQLNTTGTNLTYSASGMVYDNSTTSPWWYYMPSLSVNSSNVMLVGFSGSSRSNYISALYSARLPGGTMIGAPVLIQAGSTNGYVVNPPGVVRWGDFSYTTVDPNDNQTFWTIQGFATHTTHEYNWASWIVPVKP